MAKIILVSNRLSTSVQVEGETPYFMPSLGGLATGLSSFHSRENSLWVGWSGLPSDHHTPEIHDEIARRLKEEHKSVAVSLSSEDIDKFYLGFCNNIIWPLFHYFVTYVGYENELWNSYREINERFARAVLEVAEPDDTIWVHDYQLMLVPQLIKDELPDVKIGFFLHIPFPSFEIFRLLPWRERLLEGTLGADLIGFHTYDYARHYLSSVRRLLGNEHHMARITHEDRIVQVDVFPMGIDYTKYYDSSLKPEVIQEIEDANARFSEVKVVLSVDRLDYTKGIPQRLRAFKRFLEASPEYRAKVVLVMIVAPSRVDVPQYRELKREIEELVSTINGSFGTITWTPIQYFYRSFGFDSLCALYNRADALLVTPLRDGMNLIAKEFVAAKRDYSGAIVLSETAGAARELGEAFVVNSSNIDEIADSLKKAIELPEDEQHRRNRRMHKRLKRYDIHYWAEDFVHKLELVADQHQGTLARKLSKDHRSTMINAFSQAENALLLLDYDGTLVPFTDRPEQAVPDEALYATLRRLSELPGVEPVIISGRGKEFLDEHFGALPINLVAGHGVWLRERGNEWALIETVSNAWKEQIIPMLELHVDRTPGSSVEEKEFSLAWHYRRCEPELAAVRLSELKDALLDLTSNLDLSILEGHKVLEVKNSNINKGRAAGMWNSRKNWDFVAAIGDDHTDEDMFTVLPSTAFTVRVGANVTAADYFVDNPREVRKLLDELLDGSG